MNTLYFSIEAPFNYYVVSQVSNQSSVLEQGVFNDYLEAAARSSSCDQVIVTIPGEIVNVYPVTVPIHNRKKALLPIAYALEDQLASEVDDIEIFILDWNPKGVSSVAVMDKKRWADYIKELKSSGIEVNKIIPDYGLLHLPDSAAAVIFLEKNSERVLVKYREQGIEKGFALSQEELSFWSDDFDAQGKDVLCNNELIFDALSKSDMSDATLFNKGGAHNLASLGVDLAGVKERTLALFSLYSSGVSEKAVVKIKPWINACVCLLLLSFVTAAGFDYYEYRILKKQKKELQARIGSNFAVNFPSVTRVVDARLQFQRELDSLKGSAQGTHNFLYLLDQTIQSLPKSLATVTEIHYKQSSLDIIFTANNFQVLDSFEKDIAKSKSVIFKRISSDSQSGKVSAKFRISKNNEGGQS